VKAGPLRRVLREPVAALLVALLLAVFARCFLLQAFRIATPSMEPTLLVGDHVLVNKFVFAPSRWAWERRLLPIRDPRPGDVAAFGSPRDPRRVLVKRVAEVPGDVSPHARAGSFYALGDNRAVSEDSRSWGPVPRGRLRGRAVLVYWTRAPAGTLAPADRPHARRAPRLVR
jgi:signal peptidase I